VYSFDLTKDHNLGHQESANYHILLTFDRQKGERTSVRRPLSWNIYVKKQCRHINRAGYNNVCELID
jgi:hypothetical protein